VPADLDRFLALVRRELGAREALVVDGLEPPVADPVLEMCSRVGTAKWVAARFDAPPEDRDTKQRRLDMLASTFDTVVEETPPSRRSRPPVTSSLQDELEAVRARALALNAVVIDANSPVVWGAARADGLSKADDNVVPGPGAPPGEPEPPAIVASRRAVQLVRTLADSAGLRKGRPLRHAEREGTTPFFVRSFASIYLLVLVYDAAFDQLRAERAATEALPRIERLVLALPPQDPPPDVGAGVIAMRRPRRR
jgi:hypothetical protein